MEQLAFFPSIKKVNERKSHIYKNIHHPSESNKRYLEETLDMMMDLKMYVTSEIEFAACNLIEFGLDDKYIQYIQNTAVCSIIHCYISD